MARQRSDILIIFIGTQCRRPSEGNERWRASAVRRLNSDEVMQIWSLYNEGWMAVRTLYVSAWQKLLFDTFSYFEPVDRANDKSAWCIFKIKVRDRQVRKQLMECVVSMRLQSVYLGAYTLRVSYSCDYIWHSSDVPGVVSDKMMIDRWSLQQLSDSVYRGNLTRR